MSTFYILVLYLQCSFYADDILLQSWLWLNKEFNPYLSSIWSLWLHCTQKHFFAEGLEQF